MVLRQCLGTWQVWRVSALSVTRSPDKAGRMCFKRSGSRSCLMLALFGAQAWAAPFAYITNNISNTVSVIDTATNVVVGTPIAVGFTPFGVAVNPAGTRVYVAN